MGFSILLSKVQIMNTQNQTPSTAPQAQSQPITITLPTELHTSGFSGIAGLLQNATLLAINLQSGRSGHYLDPRQISYLQSCIEASSDLLGDVLTALSQTHLHCPNSHQFITANLLAFYAAEMGSLLPFLNQLNSNLTTRP